MFITELFLDEISDELRRSYLDRAGKVVDRRMSHMARVQDRLNKGYEIYHADRPANGSAIVDRFEADTPALARQYYEKFIHNYESDVDFDLQLRRATGIMEEPLNELGNAPAEYQPNRKRKRSLFHATVDGHWVDVFFDRSELNDTLHITFAVNGNYEASDQPTEASKSTVKILSTVLNIVKQKLPEYIAKTRPPAVSFTAKEDNRSGLYRKYFVPVIQNILGSKWAHEEFPSMNMTVFNWKPVNQIKEAFDQPYPITWEEGEFGSYDALAKLDDGTNLSIMFNLESGGPEGMDDEWQIEFWRNNSLEVTGEGDALRIFATVLTAIQEFIEKEHPERVRFSAAKDDNDNNQSRAKLYNRLVRRYAASWGYSVDVSEHAGSTVYELINNLNEITAVPTVAKSKRQHLDVMPNDGRPIPRGQESEYLTDFVSKMPGGHELWSWKDRGTTTYYVYNPETRISQLATTGRSYSENRDSFVVMGTYSGPKNTYRAADLYAFLILRLGITLVSDKKQSEGGQRVWQELERRYGRSINIHGFDTRTDKPVNVKPTSADEPDTHVDRDTVYKAGPQGKKELASISRDLRFVASAR